MTIEWKRTECQMTIDTLYNQYKKNQLDLHPYYQRGLVWNKSMKQYFIWCILRGRDISHFYLHARNEKKRFWYDVVDGQQRLHAIFEFLEDGFSLSSHPNKKHKTDPLQDGLVEGVAVAGRKFSQLPESIQRFMWTYTIHATLIESDDKWAVIEQFVDLQAGKALTPQQIREAYPSALNTKIHELENHDAIQRIRFTHNSGVSARLLLTRLFLWEYEGKLASSTPLRLTNFYLQSRFGALPDKDVDVLSELLTNSLNRMSSILDKVQVPVYNTNFIFIYWFVRNLSEEHFQKNKKRLTKFFDDYSSRLIGYSGARFFEQPAYLDAIYSDLITAYEKGDFSQPLTREIRGLRKF